MPNSYTEEKSKKTKTILLTEENSKKILPFSLEAEQSVLGAILLDNAAIEDTAKLITPEDFYTPDHREIYASMLDMFLDSKKIDHVTLIQNLVSRGIYDTDETGKQYIKTLVEILPSTENVAEYAKIIKEKAQLRRLIEACGEISGEAYSQEGNAADIVNSAEAKIFAIAERNGSSEFRRLSEIIVQVYSNLHQLQVDPQTNKGMPSGFSDIDKVLVGFNPGDLVLVGARPGMGKTAFALNIATAAAKSSGKAVAIFSLEMSCEQLATRIISSEALIDSYSLRTGQIDDEGWKEMARVTSELSKCNILIDDTSGITITGMKSKLRRVQNLGMVVVDYLQLMQSDRKIDNRVQEVSDISRNLKLMAKELGVPVITCAQLSRETEKRNGNKPQLSDLRDSGAIEQDADMVMFIYRPDYYQEKDAGSDSQAAKSTAKKSDAADTAKIIVAKNRHGSMGEVELGWIGRFTRFVSKEKYASEPPAAK